MNRQALCGLSSLLIVYVALQFAGCFMIGGAIGGLSDEPSYDTLAVSQLADVEAGTIVALTMKDQSHIEGRYVQTDTSSVSSVPQIVLADTRASMQMSIFGKTQVAPGQRLFYVPYDSVKGVTAKHETTKGKTIGNIVGAAVDVAVILLLALNPPPIRMF